MQEKLTIARPYASAAFSFAEEAGDVSAWSAMLDVLASAVAHPDLMLLISHPRITRSQLLELLREMLGIHLNDQRANFIGALLDAERLVLAPEILVLFERSRAAAEGAADVRVETAFEISAAEQDRIGSAVSTRIGKACEVTTAVTPDLLGGAVIKVGDSVIDISLRGRLRALEKQLL